MKVISIIPIGAFLGMSLATTLATTIAATGCSVPGMTATVELPALPERYAVQFWEIRWWDGRAVRKTIHEPGPAPVPARICLPIDSGGAVLPLVAAVPHVRIGDSATIVPLAPYGGWHRPDRERIVLDRHGGELAEVLFTAAGAGIDPAVLNVPRLDALIRARVWRHPRRLDRVRLATALLDLEMRSYHVSARHAPLHQIRLPLEPAETSVMPTPWTSDDAAEGPFEPAPAGYYELFSVPVMDGEVRRLWRRCPGGDSYQLLLVYRTPAGNAFHRVFSVPSISPRS